MADFTITFAADELEELDKSVRAQARDDGIALISCEGKETKTALRERCAVQSRIIGKIMDVERKAKELCPERDPNNPLLPRRDENGKT